MLPFRNAVLTAITPAGETADYDVASSPGSPRWTNREPIYCHGELVEQQNGIRIDQVIRTRLELPYELGRLVTQGDTLTFTYEDADHDRVAGTILRSPLTGRVRVVLEDA